MTFDHSKNKPWLKDWHLHSISASIDDAQSIVGLEAVYKHPATDEKITLRDGCFEEGTAVNKADIGETDKIVACTSHLPTVESS